MTEPVVAERCNPSFLRLERYSFGVGDRFAHQAKAQLRAILLAAADGAEIIPVWNKSYREHSIIGSEPASVRAAAEAAASDLGWTRPFHVDADHITRKTVDAFVASSDYYTLDVTEAIGKPTPAEQVEKFLARHPELMEPMELPGVAQPMVMSRATSAQIAAKYLFAAKEAGHIY